MTRYTYTVELNRGGDTPTWEGEATFSFTVTPGQPERGPSYDCGGTPAEPPLVEDVTLIAIDGHPRPWSPYGPEHDRYIASGFEDEIESDYTHLIAMLEIALADMQADRDEAAERLAELRARAMTPPRGIARLYVAAALILGPPLFLLINWSA